MALNPDRVRRLTGEFLRALERLRGLSAMPEEAFLADAVSGGTGRGTTGAASVEPWQVYAGEQGRRCSPCVTGIRRPLMSMP